MSEGERSKVYQLNIYEPFQPGDLIGYQGRRLRVLTSSSTINDVDWGYLLTVELVAGRCAHREHRADLETCCPHLLERSTGRPPDRREGEPRVAFGWGHWDYCGPAQAEPGDCVRCGSCCGTHPSGGDLWVCNGFCDRLAVHPPEDLPNVAELEAGERAEYERLKAKYG